MPARSEREIRRSWDGNARTPFVSVCCTTYNHGEFVREAINAVLAQETDFPFELLIHDDASTDSTPTIIREFQASHPSIVKPILQSVNQFSQGVKVNWKYNFPRATGKYIALCEGDDFWTDVKKLEIQKNYMESSPQCSLCFHDAVVVHSSDHNRVDKETFCSRLTKSTFSMKDVIRGWFIPTASMFFRRSELECPDWIEYAIGGDWVAQLLLAEKGSVDYIDRVMSAYRIHDGGLSKLLRENLFLLSNSHMRILAHIDDETSYRYEEEISRRMKKLVTMRHWHSLYKNSKFRCCVAYPVLTARRACGELLRRFQA